MPVYRRVMDKMRKTINNLLFRAGVAAVFAVVGYLGFDMHGFSVFFLVFVFLLIGYVFDR